MSWAWRFTLTLGMAGCVVLGSILAAPQAEKSEEDPVLFWSQSGGIAGFCDELKVWQTGKVIAASCKPNGGSKTGSLSKTDAAQLNRWSKSFKLTHIKNQDAGINDSMSVTLQLKGSGQDEAPEAEQQAMLEWAAKVFNSFRP